MEYTHLHIEETSSTNELLKKINKERELGEYTYLTADFQTAGKGQRGNSWESERGKNLMMTLLIRPNFLDAHKQFLISEIVALSCQDVMDYLVGKISIKWPNDIYYEDKKLGGILIEHNIIDNLISESFIGIGININQEIFISDAPNPISLKQINGEDYPIDIIAEALLNSISFYLEGVRKEIERGDDIMQIGIHKLYQSSLYRRNAFHAYRDGSGEFQAKIINVNEKGILTLETAEGERRDYGFKEVAFII